ARPGVGCDPRALRAQSRLRGDAGAGAHRGAEPRAGAAGRTCRADGGASAASPGDHQLPASGSSVRLHFLGTGTSFGVPVIGCRCATCTSPDPRDARTRHAAVVEEGGRRLLIDTPPELRLQLVRAGIDSVDAVWYTHCHADHTHGVDDLRVFSVRRGRPLEAFA